MRGYKYNPTFQYPFAYVDIDRSGAADGAADPSATDRVPSRAAADDRDGPRNGTRSERDSPRVAARADRVRRARVAGGGTNRHSPSPRTLHVAFPVAETGFDPQATSDLYSDHVQRAIFEPLYGFDYLARPYKRVPRTAAALPQIDDGGRTWTIGSGRASISPTIRRSTASGAS